MGTCKDEWGVGVRSQSVGVSYAGLNFSTKFIAESSAEGLNIKAKDIGRSMSRHGILIRRQGSFATGSTWTFIR